MDQQRIGAFLKHLRKEKGITQEQLAEALGVSGRTVSRWETGANMPDLSILIMLAEYYGVEIREILDGERKSERMNAEVKETAEKMADYTNMEKERLARRMCGMFIAGFLLFILYFVLEVACAQSTHFGDFIKGCCLGFAFGTMFLGILYTSGCMAKLRAAKMRLLGRDRAQ